ncbi:amino acid adenylation domain-containing protein [Pseudoalteromonas sp. SCSIO 43201]|uniref:non-ribosomal peptide synthetase n=1 Tax=Pseudoalteromonas sp. SCSIO 43201 TaxID=2822842 RepID=UPI002075DB43|nr:non-ribosomal peptide synthetase [Pseudoalteromonas sp. SCSIO 43201]USD29530.1 amino acid adenylation domain-containing protein [Pseudoalteromonas sp. SCSIO 43201]
MLNLCQSLAKDNIALWANVDKLKIVHGEQGLSQQWVDYLKANKTILLDYLTSQQVFSEQDFEQLLATERKRASEIRAIYDANSMQKGFVYHHLAQPNDDAYRVQLVIDYHQALDIDAYQQAWILASMRYPALRTAFNWDNEIIQVIKGGAGFTPDHFSFYDFSTLGQIEQQARIDKLIHDDRHTPFDLTKPGLMRFAIVKRSATHFTLIKAEHHSISDGWSFPVMLQTVHQNYGKLVNGEPVIVEEETAYLETQALYQQNQKSSDTYWQTQKAKFAEPNDINRLLSKSIDQSGSSQIRQAAARELKLSSERYQQLKSFAKQQGLTLNVLMQFAWHKLLQYYCDAEQTIVGTTVSGRELPVDGIHTSVGLYINTLPLALEWQEDASIATQLSALKDKIAELNGHSSVSLSQLQEPNTRLFNSLFVFENYPTPAGQDVLKWSFDKMIEKVDYPLTISVVEQQDILLLKLSFCETMLAPSKAQRLLYQMTLVLDALVADENQPHSQISLLSADERAPMVEVDEHADYLHTTIHELVTQQAQKTPTRIALVENETQLTYQELEQNANRLAAYIKDHVDLSVSQRFVGLFCQRSVDMVVAKLAILKAGCAYVPLNPDYPDQRIEYMLSDTQLGLILTQSELRPRIAALVSSCQAHPQITCLDSLVLAGAQPVLTDANAHTEAYVIYTSGTTGEPKGVVVPHRGVVSLVQNTDLLNTSEDDVFIHLSNPNFDAATFEIWTPLINGCKLVVASAQQGAEPDSLSRLIKQHSVSVLWLTRTLFDSLYLQQPTIYDHVRCVITGGEAITPSIVKSILARSARPELIVNGYGPTESTTFTTFYPCAEIDGPVPIGQAINHRQVLLLDKYQKPVPHGATGEIFIAGAGLACGYLNKPEMTASRFIDNPFASEKAKQLGLDKLYKTGDLARWSESGALEFLGRNDHQVKIRGFRIELSEIEAQLNELAQIKVAAVVVFEQAGNKQLAAYIVPENGELDLTAVKQELAQVLPSYMIPSYFEIMSALPVNNNGKLDHKKLPTPTMVDEDNYQAPSSELEKQLCSIWQSVLGLEQVGVNYDFFRVGGDSIVSIQLVSALRKAGFNLQVKDIIDAPNIAAQAYLIQHVSNDTIELRTEQGTLSGEFALLPIQKWFFDLALPDPNHWNQAFTLNLPKHIEHRALTQAIQALSAHHDMLRCHFVQTSSGIKQAYQEAIEFEVPLLDATELSNSVVFDELTKLQSHFDLFNGPLWQAALVKTAQGNQVFFAFHHVIIDVVSWRVLSQDLQTLLSGKALTDKLTSYRQWVDAIAAYPATHPEQAYYWQQVQQGFTSQPTYSAHSQHSIMLEQETTAKLLREANLGLNTEINDLLLAALNIALYSTFESSINHIQLEGHGRENIDPGLDVSQTLGWFTSMYPVRLEHHNDVITTIANTKEMLRHIPDKGVGYGAFVQADKVSAIRPQVSFNYLGQLNQQQQNQDWQLDDTHAGYVMTKANAQADNTLLLNINGAVRGTALHFDVVSRLTPSQSLAFVEHFEMALLQVINAGCELAAQAPQQTPSDLGLNDLSYDHYQALSKRYNIEALYPANSLQQGFIYHAVNFPTDDAYRVQLVMDIEQALEIEHFIHAWRLASVRFPILRTAFDWQECLLQVVCRDASIDDSHFTITDLSSLDEHSQQQAIQEAQAADRQIPFDLSQPGLIRFSLFKRGENFYTLIKTEHHAINDGWSGPLMLQAVAGYYRQLCAGDTPEVQTQQTYLEAQAYYLKNAKKTQAYWQQQQADFNTANDINLLLGGQYDLSQSRIVEQVQSVQFSLQGETFRSLQHTCQQAGVTLNVALQFAWHKLLQTYSGDNQTIVGSTVSGREIPVNGIEQAVGLFINTLPLVVNWQAEASCNDILKAIQKGVAALNSHSDMSLSKLQRDGQRLFHTLFVFENYPTPENTGSWKFRESIEKGDYPLSVVAQSESDRLDFVMHYNAEWLSAARAEWILDQVQAILIQLGERLTQRHQSISLVNKQMQATLSQWHDNAELFATDKDLASIVEQHAANYPEHTAILTSSGDALSYAELNGKANALANHIITQHPKVQAGLLPADTPIALYFSRSSEMLIAMLAVLKAGGAYVPVSPDYPEARVEFILTDTNTDLVLTQESHLPSLNPVLGKGVKALSVNTHALAVEHENLVRPTALTNLAYIIYTSGTTGQPKGVMLTQHNVLYYLHALTRQLGDKYRNIDFSSNYCFDLSVTTTLCPLLAGQTVCVYEGDILDAAAFRVHLSAANIGFVKTTPSLAMALLPGSDAQVDTLMLGGEALTEQAIDALSGHVNAIFDEYGPTETTVGAMLAQAYPRLHQGIGKAYPNVNLHVLSESLQPMPIGAPGELYISGLGVARGYLNRPEFNAERFIDNPFSHDPGHNKLYKTGDLARFLDNGDLVYLGRNDEQVKIRGYRVELGEIAAAIANQQGVQNAVVIDVPAPQGKALAAYLVAESTLEITELKLALSAALPEYMVPSHFILVEHIPLTGNGKLDRKALPAPELQADNLYVAPRNALETQLCEIWQQVLGLEQVGIEDNFFQIGGDSISAIRLMNACNKELDLNIPISALFEHTHIAAIVDNLETLSADIEIKADSGSQQEQTNSMRI